MKIEKRKRHFGLLLLFIVVLFISGLFNSGITTLTVYLLVRNGILHVASDVVPDSGKLLVFNLLLSIPVSLIVSAAVGKFPLKPIRDLIDGMDRLAAGDFKARVKAGPVLRRYPAFVAVTDSFNKMAEELESTKLFAVILSTTSPMSSRHLSYPLQALQSSCAMVTQHRNSSRNT